MATDAEATEQTYALPGRGIVAISGLDAVSWLDGLVTNDVAMIAAKRLIHSALLSPQGKVLFEFFVHYAGPQTLLLETSAATTAALIKRLGLYRLRAKVDLQDASNEWIIHWGARGPATHDPSQVADPRAPSALWRRASPANAAGSAYPGGPYLPLRVRLGLGEAPDDYELGEVFPHEINYDLQDGVSFRKGCFIGQEVVSRMQNKAVVRKRIVRLSATHGGKLVTGSAIITGAATIGRLGSVDGADALALLRLDRATEAIDSGSEIKAGEITVSIDPAAIERYRRAVADRPVIDL